jgi:antitoxin component of MazEF toxin-antitoxin module
MEGVITGAEAVLRLSLDPEALHEDETAARARREMDAKAADEAVWLAIHLCERAGWADLAQQLYDVRAETIGRRILQEHSR